MVIILMGPQGSGKTTQAEKIAVYFGIPHLESGEIFREISKENTPLGIRVRTALEAGQLVGEEDADAVIETMFEKAKYHNHVIVDGFPRDLKQAQKHRGKIDRVFNLEVSEEECIKRMSLRGRHDDTPDLIRERLRLYSERTVPVLKWFEQQSILERVDGERLPEVIFEELRDRLKRMLQTGEIELME
jgi:adenylate kinase